MVTLLYLYLELMLSYEGYWVGIVYLYFYAWFIFLVILILFMLHIIEMYCLLSQNSIMVLEPMGLIFGVFPIFSLNLVKPNFQGIFHILGSWLGVVRVLTHDISLVYGIY